MEFEPSEQFDFQEHKPTWVEFVVEQVQQFS
jgi:hypothetical protein